MNKLYKLVDLTIGLVFCSIFALGLTIVLSIFFAVLIPFMFYFIVKEVIKFLTK